MLADLTDVLLGWALEPQLTSAERRLIARVLAACTHSWQRQPALLRDVCGRLMGDLALQLQLPAHPLQPKPPQPVTDEADVTVLHNTVINQQDGQAVHEESQGINFITLAVCLVAILHAGAAGMPEQAHGFLDEAATLLTQAHSAAVSEAPSAPAAAAVHSAVDCQDAATLAGLLLVLWETAAGLIMDGADAGAGVTTTGDSTSSSSSSNANSSSIGDTAHKQKRLLAAGWRAAQRTLALPGLAADPARELLSGLDSALGALDRVLLSSSSTAMRMCSSSSSSSDDDAGVLQQVVAAVVAAPKESIIPPSGNNAADTGLERELDVVMDIPNDVLECTRLHRWGDQEREIDPTCGDAVHMCSSSTV
jgi:hypothetical protein